MSDQEYDVIVIGCGPAGCTTATLIAQKGYQVLLLDRDELPSFKVGESLIPGTYWTLKRLGMIDQMKESHFPEKYSVQFYSQTGKPSAPFYFYENETILSVIPLSFIISPAAMKKGIAKRVNESTPEYILVTMALNGKSP